VLIGCAAMCVPLLLFALFDFLSPYPTKHVFQRIVIIMGNWVPCIVLIANKGDVYGIGNVFLFLTASQRIFITGAVLSIMMDLSPVTLKAVPLRILLLSLMVIELFDVIGLATSDHTCRLISLSMRYISYLPTLFSFSTWLQYKQSLYSKGFSVHNEPFQMWFVGVSDEDYGHFLFLLVSLLHVGMKALNPLVDKNGIWYIENFNQSYLIVHLLGTSLFSLMYAVIPDRLQIYRSYKLTLELAERRVFVSHIAHEMRTPLNNANVGVVLLKAAVEKSSSKAEIDILTDTELSLSAATQILNGILDYEKLGCGAMTIDPSWTAPLAFLFSVIKPFRLQARSKGLSIVFGSTQYAEINNSDWLIYIDQPKMAQVIRNFLSNAIKFSHKGGNVEITASLVNNGNDKVLRLKVIDKGPGISIENQGKVFNSIVQFDANKLQGGGGSGIGLWVTKKIVNLHHGQVRLESTLGEGSTFILELKAIKTSELAIGELEFPCFFEHDSPISSDVSDPLAKRRRCLVVDDSTTGRKLFGRLLESMNCIVFEACDGQEAVNIISRCVLDSQSDYYDIIFMDNHMPVLGGHNAAQQMRLLGYKGLIVGVTGDTSTEDVQEYIRCGADDVLVKPVYRDDLIRVMNEIIV
jgi:signal transduction histidine kinase/ActR/RegA family two-component response regulator